MALPSPEEWRRDPIGYANSTWENVGTLDAAEQSIFANTCQEAVYQGFRTPEKRLDPRALAAALDIQNKEAVEALSRGVGDRYFYSRLLEATAPDPDLTRRVKGYCRYIVGNLAWAIHREAIQIQDPQKPNDEVLLRIKGYTNNLSAWNEYSLAIPSIPTVEPATPVNP